MLISDPDLEWDIKDAMHSDINTLVTGGDSPTRRAVAERIHQGSSREAQPFTVLDSVTEDKLESMWSSAPGGTVFIEELSGLSAMHQATLLQALEEWAHSAEAFPKARLITASAHRLYDRVIRGRFRQDLFYRLNGIHIILPLEM